MQSLIAWSAGTGFELIRNELAVAAPLILRMDSHAFDLGALWTCTLQSTHRHKHAIAFTNQKFSPILEIYFLDSIDIIIPGTAPQVGSGLLNGMHMQICDSFSIGRLRAAEGEHYSRLSHIQIRALRVALNESFAGSDLVAHQHIEDLVGLHGFLDADLQYCPVGRVHGGIPERPGVHLSQTLVPADLWFLSIVPGFVLCNQPV